MGGFDHRLSYSLTYLATYLIMSPFFWPKSSFIICTKIKTTLNTRHLVVNVYVNNDQNSNSRSEKMYEDVLSNELDKLDRGLT